jgi:hypothetical protein
VRIASSRRVLRGAALVAVPAALWAFTASVYAWEGVKITATPNCDHQVVVKGTDNENGDLAHNSPGTLDITGPNGATATAPWTWPGGTGAQTIATLNDTGAPAGTYHVALHEDSSVSTTFELPPSCPSPSPSPSPTPTPTPKPSSTPTPSGQGQGTPGLPNTGAGPA